MPAAGGIAWKILVRLWFDPFIATLPEIVSFLTGKI
jgi:hypothetical protein